MLSTPLEQNSVSLAPLPTLIVSFEPAKSRLSLAPPPTTMVFAPCIADVDRVALPIAENDRIAGTRKKACNIHRVERAVAKGDGVALAVVEAHAVRGVVAEGDCVLFTAEIGQIGRGAHRVVMDCQPRRGPSRCLPRRCRA